MTERKAFTETSHQETVEQLIALLSEKLKSVDHPFVTVDGPCASGKTTLAEEVAKKIHASVVHTDEYVVPHAQKTAERLSVPGGNCDVDRLVREIGRAHV